MQKLPQVALSSSDELAVEAAAICLQGLWDVAAAGGALNPAHARVDAALKGWLMQLGMTVQARTKIPARPAGESANPFGAINPDT